MAERGAAGERERAVRERVLPKLGQLLRAGDVPTAVQKVRRGAASTPMDGSLCRGDQDTLERSDG